MIRPDSRRTPSGTLHLGAATALCGLALLTSCGSRSNSAAPRIQSIPAQTSAGKGAMFTLDLDPFVSDREGETLTYTVVSGGGTFSGSMYQGTFDTLGEFDVVFQVADSVETSQGTFRVVVTQAEFAVVRRDGDGLSLLDTDTQQFITATASSTNETFRTGLTTGEVLLERTLGGNTDLVSFDAFSRTTTAIGDDLDTDETYVGKTSSDLVVFQRADGSGDTDLFTWNPVTKFVRTVSATDGEQDGNAVISGDDLIYFERTSGSQPDVVFYDPADDSTTVVADESTAERIVTTLPDGGLVFSRVSGTGETDLFYFKLGTGTVEIGGDRSGTIGTKSKTFEAHSSQSHVVFTTAGTTSGNRDVFFWTPSTGATTDIASDVSFTAQGISSDDVFVWSQVASSQDDLFGFTIPTDSAPFTISANAADETFRGFATQSGMTYVVYERAGTPATVEVYDVTNTTTAQITDAAGVGFEAILANGDVVVRLADGSAVQTHVPSTATTTTVTTSLTATSFDFAGAGSDAGDFVVSAEVSMQTDLHLWDASAGSIVTISADAGDDAFQAFTSSGDILFTRITTTGQGNQDLFFFDVDAVESGALTTGTTTDDTFDHTVVGSISVNRS